MWIVAKVKRSEFGLFQNEIKKKISNRVIFYFPKIKQNIQKKGSVKESYVKILEDYIFCYSKTFECKNFFNSIQFIKGLKYFLQVIKTIKNKFLISLTIVNLMKMTKEI